MGYVLGCRTQERFHRGPKSRHTSFGCAPTSSLASPTFPLPGFMGNKLRPKDKHSTFLQTLKQRKGKREMYCGVFQLYAADIATCPLLFQRLRVSFSVNSNYQSQNTILKLYFSTKKQVFRKQPCLCLCENAIPSHSHIHSVGFLLLSLHLSDALQR